MREDDDQTCFRRNTLRSCRDIQAVIDEHSVAQNMMDMNSENSNSNIVYSKLVRRASRSFVGAAMKHAKRIKCYRDRNFMLETELTKMKDITTSNRRFIKKLAADAVLEKIINNTLLMKISEHRKTILGLIVKLVSLKLIKAHTEKG